MLDVSPRHVPLPPALTLALVLAGISGLASCSLPGHNKVASQPATTTGSGGASGTGGTAGGTGGAGGAPDPNAALDGRRLRRLSNREYDNVVRDLLGDNSHPARDFIADSYQNGYDNGSTSLTIQSDQADALQVAAEQLAARVAPDMQRLFGACDETIDPTLAAACAGGFLTRFPQRAFRRPLNASELRRMRDVYEAGAAVGGITLGAQLVVEAVLQSPQFLYREELGESRGVSTDVPPEGFVRLSPYELASELSFLMTGSLPDDVLWTAVEQGHFTTAADLLREARRLRNSTAAAATFRTLLHQWLATDRLPVVIKDTNVYPYFSRALAASMLGELDRFYDKVLDGGAGSLRTLFTSTASFVDSPLGHLYGFSSDLPAAGTPDSGGFVPVPLDGKTRRGVLTRSGFLTVHSDLDSSGPIPRGVFMLDQVLCVPPPAPPADIPAPASAADAAMNKRTTRDRFDAHVSRKECQSCHTLIDGYGFGFEEFDGIGVYRTTENEVPVDTSGTVRGLGDANGPFVGVSELSDRLVGSTRLPDCFVRQMYRFAMGQVETAAEKPLLDTLSAGFTVDTPVADLLMTLIERPEFVLRHVPPDPGLMSELVSP